MFIDLKALLTAFFSAIGGMDGMNVPETAATSAQMTDQVRCDVHLESVEARTVLVAEVSTGGQRWGGDFHVLVTGSGANMINLAQSGTISVEPHRTLRIAQFDLGGTAQENFDATCSLSD